MEPGAGLPPSSDRALGLEFYVTSTPGARVVVKQDPEDFSVREISAYPTPDDLGRFTVLRIESRNWEQHELVQRIAREVHVPPRLFRWAGTKDRRAVAERLVSYPGPPPDQDVSIPDVRVLEAYRAREGLVLGHHYGNAFRVRLRLPTQGDRDRRALDETLTALRRLGGFANLFGPQRFGEVRPVTHLVGRSLVRGDVDGAVALYLEYCSENSPSFGDDARRAYAAHHDPVRALKEFPASFRFERTLLDHLAHGQSPRRAFQALPHPLRELFIHAYQAWLFNRWLSRRMERSIAINRPVVGDRLLRLSRDGTFRGTDPVPVERDNLEECLAWAESGRAGVAGPLVGAESPAGESVPEELMTSLLEDEGVGRTNFELRATPELSSRGSWRPTWCPLPPIGVHDVPEGIEQRSVSLTFALPKGVYATVLLRELSKGLGAVGAAPMETPPPVS